MVFLSLMVLLLIYANVVLLIYHAPTTKRPLDIALIHAPLRLFLILPLSLTLPHNILYVSISFLTSSPPTLYAELSSLRRAASR